MHCCMADLSKPLLEIQGNKWWGPQVSSFVGFPLTCWSVQEEGGHARECLIRHGSRQYNNKQRNTTANFLSTSYITTKKGPELFQCLSCASIFTLTDKYSTCLMNFTSTDVFAETGCITFCRIPHGVDRVGDGVQSKIDLMWQVAVQRQQSGEIGLFVRTPGSPNMGEHYQVGGLSRGGLSRGGHE